ncbi:MAG TPA: hypothetical protein EYG11_16830 [Candidatus Latescibacteria bacterium]|nr:hypothetical protein [Candidatus Handelsmanbacteria bacterium]HIL10368.1 hypothetical protein [Candidatus Latescibacterota bacterium]
MPPATLYHASEEGDSALLHHASAAPANHWFRPVGKPHRHNYLLADDCPHLCFWALPGSNPDTVERFLGTTTFILVLAVENIWLDRIRQNRPYLYEMWRAQTDRCGASDEHRTTRQITATLNRDFAEYRVRYKVQSSKNTTISHNASSTPGRACFSRA